jgi:hypothetical protein
MNCTDLQQQLDDLLDDRLPQEMLQTIDEHIRGCLSCQKMLEQERAFRQLLSSHPAPSVRPEFVEQVLKQGNKQRPVKLWQGFAAGVASTVAAGVLIVLMFNTWQSTPVTGDNLANIALDVNEQRTLNLVFNVPQDLPGATLSVVIPNHIKLAGYPDQKRFVWQADLVAGHNVLTLPVVAVKANQGQIIATVTHGQDQKHFRFMLTVNSPHALGLDQVVETRV